MLNVPTLMTRVAQPARRKPEWGWGAVGGGSAGRRCAGGVVAVLLGVTLGVVGVALGWVSGATTGVAAGGGVARTASALGVASSPAVTSFTSPALSAKRTLPFI